jgi:uncharacterized damage-inducible protein DinB
VKRFLEEKPVNSAVLEMPASEMGAGLNAIVTVLQQLCDVLEKTTADEYAMKPVDVVNSSIAGHVRHCLDHVAALLIGAATGRMSYDDRERGTEIETCRFAAIRAIQEQVCRLEELCEKAPDQPISLRVQLSAAGPEATVQTSLGRELSFVLSHTIHHNALIAVIAKLLDIAVPDRFGYAPSTLAYLEHR